MSGLRLEPEMMVLSDKSQRPCQVCMTGCLRLTVKAKIASVNDSFRIVFYRQCVQSG